SNSMTGRDSSRPRAARSGPLPVTQSPSCLAAAVSRAGPPVACWRPTELASRWRTDAAWDGSRRHGGPGRSRAGRSPGGAGGKGRLNFLYSVLKTPVRTPVANAICERVLGMLRRECLGFVIPLSADHLRRLLTQWVQHYNNGRPHMSLGPGIPQPSVSLLVPLRPHRHRLSVSLRVTSCPIL